MSNANGTAPKMTNKETAVAKAVLYNDFRETADMTEMVWTMALAMPAGMSTRSMHGVLISLQTKGIVTLVRDGADIGIAFTKAGISVMRAAL
jgi:hypothetical protein